MDIKPVLQRFRVPLGFLFGGLFIVLSRPTLRSLAWGLPLVVAGLAIRVWAAGHLRRKGWVLARGGPYAFTRNPLYLGSFFIGIGFALQSGIWLLIPVFAVLFLAVYLPVMRQEERELANGHGEEYQEFIRRVPRFVPAPWPRHRGGEQFSWALVWQNREYNAPVGALIAGLILLVKVYFPFP